MPRFPLRSVCAFAPALTLLVISNTVISNTASAQWGPFGNACNCQPAIAPMAAGPVFSQTAMTNPCITQSVAANPCPCIQPVHETVYRDVPVTEYRKEVRTVKKPVVRTVYEDQPVTAYRQIMVDKVCEVPSVDYQTITECKPVTVNRSYWRTVHQPVMKGCACDYDRRPTLLGWFNRQRYELRMAMTPNYINRREFVPNVQAYNVPVQRTVSIPTTRQVTYKVSQLEPYQTTQKVARSYTEYVDEQVTVEVPYTTTKTVAVGTRTRMAYVDPFGGSGTATAHGPVSDRTAEHRVHPKKQSSTNANDNVKLQNYEAPAPQSTPPQRFPAGAESDPFDAVIEHGNAEPTPSNTNGGVAWIPVRQRTTELNETDSQPLPVVAAR